MAFAAAPPPSLNPTTTKDEPSATALAEFLAVSSQFRLGSLVTEQPHPKTRALSELAREDLPAAVAVLKEVELDAYEAVAPKMPELADLAAAVGETLRRRRSIFLCGCGATGRLSISLEVFARHGLLGRTVASARIAGFMAGGDCALIRSIESFEDHPEYGERQLLELGFRAGDLLIATTEGGETPFVIGAAEAAARISPGNPPFFLYCNPDDVLAAAAERSRRVIDDPGIFKINLTCGPMAVTGSTRMQASSVLMAAVGWAIAHRTKPDIAALAGECAAFRERLAALDLSFLPEFVAHEAGLYQAGARVLYEAAVYGVTALTDTTERSPTFSLAPFENTLSPGDVPSLCYFHLPGAPDAAAAWAGLLGREPRPLEWEGLAPLTGRERLEGFDISDRAPPRRAELGPGERFTISDHRDTARLRFGDLAADLPMRGVPGFSRQLLMKALLNIHSTLVMARLGRVQGNLMTHVSPTNNKLIDRAVRYVTHLIDAQPGGGAAPPYEEIAAALFAGRATLKPGEPIVMKTFERLCGGAAE